MICVPIKINPLFQKISAVIVSEIDSVNKFALIITTIIERDFKSEYLICTCSVATDLVTSVEFNSDLCYYAVPFLANHGTAPYSLILTPIATLLQKTERFRNGMVEMGNMAI